jgi:hypothetical protein
MGLEAGTVLFGEERVPDINFHLHCHRLYVWLVRQRRQKAMLRLRMGMLSRVGALGKVGGHRPSGPSSRLRAGERGPTLSAIASLSIPPEILPLPNGARAAWDHRRGREKKSRNRLHLDALRRSINGGSGESVAALRATGRRDLRRLRGRMMKATIPAKSAKRTTTTTNAASVVISGTPQMPMISFAFAGQVESALRSTAETFRFVHAKNE